MRSEIFFESGLTHEENKNISMAIEAYREALSFKPQNGDAHRRLAGAFLRQGEYGHALEHALKANDLGSPVDPLLLGKIRAKAAAIQ